MQNEKKNLMYLSDSREGNLAATGQGFVSKFCREHFIVLNNAWNFILS